MLGELDNAHAAAAKLRLEAVSRHNGSDARARVHEETQRSTGITWLLEDGCG
jgi:hypothetical protein